MENYVEFLDRLAKEIDYQAKKWSDGTWEGLATHDAMCNSLNDFIVYITKYASNSFIGDYEDVDDYIKFNTAMIKVAALAYSAFVLGKSIVDDMQ